MSYQRYQDPAADAALGTTTDDPYTGTGTGTLVSLLKGLFLKPVSTLTGIGDGGNVAQGATTDAAYTSGSGTVVSLLKGIFALLRGGQATMANSLPVTLASDQSSLPVAAGPKSVATSPPAATLVATDTPYTFPAKQRHLDLQNKTSATVYYAFDAAASLGSFALAAGASVRKDVEYTVLHLYTAAAQNINGTADLNIVVEGRS